MESIPKTKFRLPRGYDLREELGLPEFVTDNLLIGGDSGGGVEGIFLGKLSEFGHNNMGKNLWLDTRGAHAIYIMGKRRSGKTYTLGTIAEGLASNSWLKQGSTQQAILILDTLNVFITMPNLVAGVYPQSSSVLSELKKWSMPEETIPLCFYYPKGTQPPPAAAALEMTIRPNELDAEDWAGLFELDTFSDPMGQLMAELYERVKIEGYSDSNSSWHPAKSDFSIQDLLQALDEDQQLMRFDVRTMEGLRRRLKAVARLPIFSDRGIDVSNIFLPGQISIALLAELDQQVRGLLIGVLVKKIMQLRRVADRYERLAMVEATRLEREREATGSPSSVTKKKLEDYLTKAKEGLARGFVIIDEAHNYIPARGLIASKEPLKKYVNEARNIGLSIVVATQQPSGLDSSIRRNADVLIIHSMSMRDDIDAAQGMINTYVPEYINVEGRDMTGSRAFEQLVRSLDLGYAVLSSDRANRICVLKIRPRLTVHGGIDY
jgi:hypothetical protein